MIEEAKLEIPNGWNGEEIPVNTLYMTVGLPKSGKTTWARSTGYPIVSPDSIRLALHGQRFEAKAEPMVWAIAKIMVRALFDAGHKNVILDATSNTRKRRDDFKEFRRVFVRFPDDKDTCLKRAEAVGDFYIAPVIERMASEHEPVVQDELSVGEGEQSSGDLAVWRMNDDA